jgi:hypothetical protein
MEPFAEREVLFREVRRHGGWSLKVYSVRHGSEAMDWEGFDAAYAPAVESLPAPDLEAGRPGLGFFIAHQGRTGDYAVLGWWNRENELPLKISVRRDRNEPWRPAAEGESICIWDLEVIWEERQAWIETMLSPAGPNGEAYLSRVFPEPFKGVSGELPEDFPTAVHESHESAARRRGE